MVNDDLVKCPLCDGFTHVDKPQLLAALQDPNIRQQVETFIEQLLRQPSGEPAMVTSPSTGRDFHKIVHQWNPYVPVWRRSPKG
jgi:hypothetical protein